MFLIICLAAFTLLLVESTVAVHRMVNFSLVVFSQITDKPLARMTVTGRMLAKERIFILTQVFSRESPTRAFASNSVTK